MAFQLGDMVKIKDSDEKIYMIDNIIHFSGQLMYYVNKSSYTECMLEKVVPKFNVYDFVRIIKGAYVNQTGYIKSVELTNNELVYYVGGYCYVGEEELELYEESKEKWNADLICIKTGGTFYLGETARVKDNYLYQYGNPLLSEFHNLDEVNEALDPQFAEIKNEVLFDEGFLNCKFFVVGKNSDYVNQGYGCYDNGIRENEIYEVKDGQFITSLGNICPMNRKLKTWEELEKYMSGWAIIHVTE